MINSFYILTIENIKNSLTKANKIRTELLIKISNELNTKKKNCIKINSLTSNDLAKKYSNYVIIEQDYTTGSPLKLCSNVYLNSGRESTRSCLSVIARSSSGSLDKTLNFIAKRKYTISQRKLKLLHGSPLPHKKRDIDSSSFYQLIQILILKI